MRRGQGNVDPKDHSTFREGCRWEERCSHVRGQEKMGRKDLFLQETHLLSCSLSDSANYVSVCTSNPRNFHCTLLRKSLHFLKDVPMEGHQLLCECMSAGKGRAQKKKKKKKKNRKKKQHPKQQGWLEKVVRSLKRIQTTALEIRLKNLVTSGFLWRWLLFPAGKPWECH